MNHKSDILNFKLTLFTILSLLLLCTNKTYAQNTRMDDVRIRPYMDTYGNMTLHQSNITVLPDHLIIAGNLDLSDSKILKLPNYLEVKKGLSAPRTKLKEFPKIKVGTYIDLTDSQVSILPKKLRVNGDLALSGTPLTQLPVGLYVKGNLYISDTLIKKLPEQLYVSGDLYMQGTPLTPTDLPASAHVGGIIYFSSNNLETKEDIQ